MESKQIVEEKQSISFIIPVYNVESTLERAVQSIISQEVSENYEILLINDGSTDSSGTIADQLSQNNQHIKVFHKENGGLASARNHGLEKAQGELIAFLDSDDYFLPGTFKQVMQAFEDAQTSLVIFGLKKGNEDREMELIPEARTETDPLESIRLSFKSKAIDFYAWNKVYRQELFNTVRFPEGKLYEDIMPSYEVLKQAKKVVYLPIAGIYYYQNSESIVHQSFNAKQYDNITQRKLLFDEITKDFPALIGLAMDKLIDGYLSTGYKITQKPFGNQNRIYLKTARKEIRMFFMSFMKNPDTGVPKKLALLIFLTNGTAYHYLYKKYLGK